MATLRSAKRNLDPGNGKPKKTDKFSEEPPWVERPESQISSIGIEITQLKEKFEGKIDSLSLDLKEVSRNAADLSSRLEKAQQRIVDLEARSCRNNIRIVGLKEKSESANTLDYFAKMFQSLFPEVRSLPLGIEMAHRIGTLKLLDQGKNRHIVVCFLRFKDKDCITKLARKIRLFQYQDSEICFFEDFPREIVKKWAGFASVMKLAYQKKLFPLLQYPAKRRLLVKKSGAYIFDDPAEALHFINSLPDESNDESEA